MDLPDGLRLATLDDVASLARIHARSWFAGFAPGLGAHVANRAIAQRCTTDKWVRNLETSQVLVGDPIEAPSGLLQFRTRGNRAEVERLYVEPEQWGSGLAHRLMDTVLATLREAGVTSVRLHAADTSQARRFYDKRGFTATGRTHTYLTVGEVEVTDTELTLELVRAP